MSLKKQSQFTNITDNTESKRFVMFYLDICYKSEKLDHLFFLTLILGMYQYITIPIFPDR